MREHRAAYELLGERIYLRRLCAAQELQWEPLARALLPVLGCAGDMLECFALCRNAVLIALAAHRDGMRVFASADEVLEGMSIGDIADAAQFYYESFGGDGESNA